MLKELEIVGGIDKMSVMKTRRFFAALVMMICAMMFSTQAWAVHTRVGVPASRSYVSSDYEGRVIIYAGDSRTMYMTANSLRNHRKNSAFVWINGGGVSYIDNGGRLESRLNDMIDRYRGRCVVIFNFGINGNGSPVKNAKRITKVYRRYMSDYSDVPFFVESVNPSGYNSGGYGNPKIEKLNSLLSAEFGDRYIDVYNYLINSGVVTKTGGGTKDKLHYKQKANLAIYSYTKYFVDNYGKSA